MLADGCILSHVFVFIIVLILYSFVTFIRLEPLTDRTVKLLFAHFVALGAQLEVFGPFVVALGPSFHSLAILTLHAVIAAIALSLDVQFQSLIFCVHLTLSKRVKRSQP